MLIHVLRCKQESNDVFIIKGVEASQYKETNISSGLILNFVSNIPLDSGNVESFQPQDEFIGEYFVRGYYNGHN